MTNEEIRIKVAEAMGARLWNNPTQSGPSQLWGFQAPSPGEVFARMWLCGETDCLLPDYPEDLNACAEFRKTLTDTEKERYVWWLNHLHSSADIHYTTSEKHIRREVFDLIDARPIEHCLAYLKTKGILP